jgi:hypothetical protein
MAMREELGVVRITGDDIDFTREGNSSPMKTYYEVLGVAMDATGAEIEEACWNQVKDLGLEVEKDSTPQKTRAFKEFMAALRVLSNPVDRMIYDEELRGSQPQEDLVTTDEYEVPMGLRKREDQQFDIDDETRLSVLRTGGGKLTFTTNVSGQVIIRGNPPPYAEIRDRELVIAASDYNAELSLPRRIEYDMIVRSHQGKLAGVITHGGTIEAHDTDIDIEVGGTIDLDVRGSLQCPQLQVHGFQQVEEGLYLAPGRASAARSLVIKARGGALKVRYSVLEFD